MWAYQYATGQLPKQSDAHKLASNKLKELTQTGWFGSSLDLRVQLMELDKLLAFELHTRFGTAERTMGEILKSDIVRKALDRDVLHEIWWAHKVRNDWGHSPDFDFEVGAA